MKLYKHLKYFTALLLLFAAATSFAQSGKKKLADRYYQEFKFEKAAEIYEDVLEIDDNDIFALKRAAECRKNLGQYSAAEVHLEKLANLSLVRAEDLLLYADILKVQGEYQRALMVYEKYMMMKPEDQYIRKYLQDGNWAEQIVRDSSLYTITNSAINSESSDFAPCFVEGKVMFSSARGQGRGKNNIYNWTDQSYLNLFTAEVQSDSSLNNVQLADSEANSRFHEGTVAYDEQNKEMFFTRNFFYKGKKVEGSDGRLNLAIFHGSYENGELGRLKEFPFNDEEYSIGHPTLTPDGQTMYFTSDMPGGIGGTDIYKTQRNGDFWSDPVNLGPEINTPNDEMFPYMDAKGVLHFASNGHPGLGGLDLFYIDAAGEVKNFGYPVNSSFDDFALITFANGKGGYFSSNRPGGVGDDDIYEFVIRQSEKITISGIVLDAQTKKEIKNATILLKDENNEEVLQVVANTDSLGYYSFDVDFDKTYTIIGVKNGYFQEEIQLITNERSGYIDGANLELMKYSYASEGHVLRASDGEPIEGAMVTLYDENREVISQMPTLVDGSYFFGLEKEKKYFLEANHPPYPAQEIVLDTRGRPATIMYSDFRLFMLEAGTVVRLDNIYYDYNKATLRPESEQELDKLVKILKDNPGMIIELSSHTDARGTDAYNLSLSKRRAQSAVNYLLKKGIAKSRLQPKGYGESKLLNRCKNNVECTEEEHQLNRRTEFKILRV
jgi:outer membrane protein OmpA-like peptidoglycan-associated protein